LTQRLSTLSPNWIWAKSLIIETSLDDGALQSVGLSYGLGIGRGEGRVIASRSWLRRTFTDGIDTEFINTRIATKNDWRSLRTVGVLHDRLNFCAFHAVIILSACAQGGVLGGMVSIT
jgi:hypothetical protein